jgi:hypothetical protein
MELGIAFYFYVHVNFFTELVKLLRSLIVHNHIQNLKTV